MTDDQLFRWLNQAALVVMAGSFIWLVKTVVNDMKHDLIDIKGLLKEIRDGLASPRKGVKK